MTPPGPLFTVRKCEDTGKPALYKATSYGGGKARLLVEHEDYLWEMYSTLAKYFEQRAKTLHEKQYVAGDE